MRSWHKLVCPSLTFTALVSVAGYATAQTTIGSYQVPLQSTPRPALQSVSEWSKQVLELANSTWTESNPAVRGRMMLDWAEKTPAQLAYVTRILQQHDQSQTASIVQTLKEIFGLIKRNNWQRSDQQQMQRIVATWSVIAPQLIKIIDSRELAATQRRVLEQALIDLAIISRDAQIGSPLAQQTWQAQVSGLGRLTRHPKLSVKLVALGVLEAIGTDAHTAGAAVQESLRDSDRFVRWAAVRALQSMGMDETTTVAVSRLKNDEDAQVRQVVMEALSGGNTAAMNRTETKQPSLPVPISLEPTIPVSSPSAESTKTAPTAINLREDMAKSTPVPPKETFTPSSTPALLPALPQQTPVTKPNVTPEPVPLFGPPPVSKSIKPSGSSITPVQLSTAVTPPIRQSPPGNQASLWIPRLRQGTVDQQLQAVRELAKLGEGAAESVPLLAENLISAHVSVRREIPVALAKIGSPAKLATSVLERALQDSDTDVKVNAARALLELADK